MASPSYSKSVVQGMLRHGLSVERIAHLSGMAAGGVEKVLAGRGRLSDARLRQIEESTGVTAGQFAGMAVGGAGRKGLAGVMDLWAETRDESATPQVFGRG